MTATVSMAEVATINPRGDRPSNDEDVAFVGMADLSAETALTGPGLVRPFGEVSKGYTIFRNGDLLVAKITPCFENGKIGQAQLARAVGVGSTEFHVVRPDPNRLDVRYAMHFLRRERIRREGERRMTGSGGQRRVPAAFLSALELALPSIEEQRRIAVMLDHASLLRSVRAGSLVEVDKFASALAADLSARVQNGDIPVAPLAMVAERVCVGHVGPTSQYFADSGIPFLRTGNIGERAVLTNDLKYVVPEFHARLKKSQLRTGDVLISRVVGSSIRCAVLPPELDGANCANIIVVRPGPNIDGEVLAAFLRSEPVQRRLLGRRVGSAQSVVNTTVLKQLLVPAASSAVQDKLSAELEATRQLRGRLESSTGLHLELFKALQARAFSGMV